MTVAALLWSTSAVAQGESREDEAQALFHAGRAAFDAGHFDTALSRFEEAYELSGRTLLLYNIGVTAERLRRDARALEAFEQYLTEHPNAENASQVRARIEILRESLARGETSAESDTPSESEDVDAPVAPTDRRTATITGAVLSGAGLVGLGVAWGFYGSMRGSVSDFRGDGPTTSGFLDRQSAMDAAETRVYFTGLGAGLIATLGMPLWLPDRGDVPWWSYVIGAAGLGLAAGGVVALASQSECVDQLCTRREPSGALGALLLGHALPLLAVPLTYLLRKATGSRLRASMEASPHAVRLEIGGVL